MVALPLRGMEVERGMEEEEGKQDSLFGIFKQTSLCLGHVCVCMCVCVRERDAQKVVCVE
jgi:hypothetical protein